MIEIQVPKRLWIEVNEWQKFGSAKQSLNVHNRVSADLR